VASPSPDVTTGFALCSPSGLRVGLDPDRRLSNCPFASSLLGSPVFTGLRFFMPVSCSQSLLCILAGMRKRAVVIQDGGLRPTLMRQTSGTLTIHLSKLAPIIGIVFEKCNRGGMYQRDKLLARGSVVAQEVLMIIPKERRSPIALQSSSAAAKRTSRRKACPGHSRSICAPTVWGHPHDLITTLDNLEGREGPRPVAHAPFAAKPTLRLQG
jgi:hypothetical protein